MCTFEATTLSGSRRWAVPPPCHAHSPCRTYTEKPRNNGGNRFSTGDTYVNEDEMQSVVVTLSVKIPKLAAEHGGIYVSENGEVYCWTGDKPSPHRHLSRLNAIESVHVVTANARIGRIGFPELPVVVELVEG